MTNDSSPPEWQPGPNLQIGPRGGVAGARYALERFRKVGVCVPGGTRLETAIGLVELTNDPTQITAENLELQFRLVDSMRTCMEFYLIARALVGMNGVLLPAKKEKVEIALGGAEREAQDTNSLARNTQFELFVSATLTAGGAFVTLGGPDLLMVYDGESVGIAVKRLRSKKQIRKRFNDGVKQIKESGLRGFVALNLDLYLEGADLTGDAAQKGAGFDVQIADAVREIAPLVSTEPNVLGVLFFGTYARWRFSDALPRLQMSVFRKFIILADDERERVRSEAFFSAVERQLHETLRRI